MSQRYEIPRRPPPNANANANADELHMQPGASNNNHHPNSPMASSQRGHMSPRDYAAAGPRINLEPGNAAQLPGALQPGRPSLVSANSSNAVPTTTLSHDQYATPSRSATLGPSHNYTRSSPAGFDGQSYAPFATPTTPGGGDQFTSPTNQKYTPQNSQRTVSNTPLGLADIRPRADSGISEGIPGANPYSFDGASAVPTNSNYLAPWAIYAFDWCKWPAQNHDAGKVAVGSYLEDGHNFVSASLGTGFWIDCLLIFCARFKF